VALRKLYLVCVIAHGQPGDAFPGFTVARSTDEVQRIVRLHEPRRKLTTFINEVTENPVTARDCVPTFLSGNFLWLDPRPRRERRYDDVPIADVVHRLMTQDIAL
jgi:hypothetical protein